MLLSRFKRRLSDHAAWGVYIATALLCAAYLNERADLVPKWGQWYAEGEPYVLLQVRAFLSGHIAPVQHPSGSSLDYLWGRGGMHQVWGLGVPILATPFHILGRLFRAPGFPDHVRFLVLYAATTVALARALHGVSRDERTALIPSAAAAGFVMLFPTYVGLISARFLVYDQTIATGALWDVALLAGVLALLSRCTPGRLVFLCAAAGFSIVVRPPLGVYGLTTAVLALLIARRAGMNMRALIAGFGAYVATTSIYFAGNVLRFGAPFNDGYRNCVAGAFVNRLNRWGLPFAKVPFVVAAKEMFATDFLLEPTPSHLSGPPASIKPYAVGERFREYYAPTFGRLVFAVWVAAVAIVCWRIVAQHLWRRDRLLGGEIITVIGVWALPPSIVLFAFYARIGNMVTRYASDLYPAFAAAFLCVGMAIVAGVRRRSPTLTGSAQLAIAAVLALYMSGWRGWATQLSHPTDRAGVLAQIDYVDSRVRQMPRVPNHFRCGAPRGPSAVYDDFDDWHGDCSFSSGLVFAMPRSRCVSFTFRPGGAAWNEQDDQSLAAFRAVADSDRLVSCGPPKVEGDSRQLTVCESRPPAYLLDGLRLYAVASLDENLTPLDRLKLMRIDATSACP
jgi:hypothetical protein